MALGIARLGVPVGVKRREQFVLLEYFVLLANLFATLDEISKTKELFVGFFLRKFEKFLRKSRCYKSLVFKYRLGDGKDLPSGKAAAWRWVERRLKTGMAGSVRLPFSLPCGYVEEAFRPMSYSR